MSLRFDITTHLVVLTEDVASEYVRPFFADDVKVTITGLSGDMISTRRAGDREESYTRGETHISGFVDRPLR